MQPAAIPEVKLRPRTRKITDALLFELGGILVGGAALTLMSDAGATRSLSLSSFGAALAMLWSLLVNTIFEAWEARQTTRGRSTLRRIAHACPFATPVSSSKTAPS